VKLFSSTDSLREAESVAEFENGLMQISQRCLLQNVDDALPSLFVQLPQTPMR
jgi:hypothetical protein